MLRKKCFYIGNSKVLYAARDEFTMVLLHKKCKVKLRKTEMCLHRQFKGLKHCAQCALRCETSITHFIGYSQLFSISK